MNVYRTSNKKYLKTISVNRTNKRKVLWLIPGVLLGIVVLAFIFTNFRNKAASSVISKITKTQALNSENGRINVLLLGLDRRVKQSSVSGVLTDTIMIGSVDEQGRDAYIVSVPRDLWVPYGNTQYQGKINAVYNWGGIPALVTTLERITGQKFQYYLVVGFDGFIKAVDTVGGLQVDVKRTFDDYEYPVEGKEDVYPEEERYTHIHFDSGLQTLTGLQALQFARSRHAQGDEGTDFARSARQQQIIVGFKDQILSHTTLFNPAKIKLLYDIFKEYVETNINLEDALCFYDLSKKLDSSMIKNEVISDNLLYNPQDSEHYGGAWVLVPKAGDFSQIQEFFKKLSVNELDTN